MFASDFIRTAATIACTIVFSATCVLGAVGPANQIGVSRVTQATRLVA